MICCKPPQRQRGAAILLAMLVVTLVATLAAGLQWRQWRQLQLESAMRTQSQAAWVLVGALDWARLILREDARSASGGNAQAVDHLGEPWALPLQEAKLSSFLSADALAEAGQDEAYLSGQILDAQAKINLNNLTNNGIVSDVALQSLQRLYLHLGLPSAEIKEWTWQWIQSDPAFADKKNTTQDTGVVGLRPERIEQLHWLGVPARSAKALMPYLTILPQRTTVNLNTASAAVIYAVVPDIDVATARAFVDKRAQSPAQTLADASKMLGGSGGASLNAAEVGVNSGYFEVHGRLRLGDWSIDETSLVQRTGLDVKALWRSRSHTYN